MRQSTLEPAPQTQDERVFKRSEEHTSELQSRSDLVCRLLLEKKNRFVIATGPKLEQQSLAQGLFPTSDCLRCDPRAGPPRKSPSYVTVAQHVAPHIAEGAPQH